MNPTSFACDLSAIPAAERPAHARTTRELVSSAQIAEQGEGFVFRVPADRYALVRDFVQRERRCCPFLEFAIVAGPDPAQVELRISGPPGAKDFIRHALHLPTN